MLAIPLRISGRCLFANGEEHACQTRELSPDDAVIIAPVTGEIGDPVTLYLENIGVVAGVIRGVEPDGFRIAIEVGPERRARIAARIEWFSARASGRVDQRSDVRIVPVSTAVEVRLPDGTVRAGTIMDLSMTGAAVAVEPRPDIGSQVAVGKRFATVVRHLDGGIAVAFKLPFRPETFSQHVVL